ncbi:MAG: DUF2723 domain-containing protein [Terrimicrobiaceae bacterium]
MNWWRSHKQELLAGAISGLISFGVYAWSAAPNVTLLDSGEFIVAAQHFGVPHPTGYPLWTLLSWLFQLLPLGNAAWEINLFSGVCGAMSVAMAAGILTNLLLWFLGGELKGLLRFLPPIVGIAFALMLAFSVSMWSQAVIAEVYALHALLVAVYLALLYGWVRNPSHDKLMLGAFFTLALCFSNHHLTLTLAPLPFLLILLLRRRALPDWIFAGTLTALLAYLGFAILSQDIQILKTAIRFFYVVVAAAAVFVWMRRLRIRWKLVAFLPVAVGAGLLPYAYMPIASSTNPPMNWAYARDLKGFYYSINRSQYSGSLSEKSLTVLGRLMGTGTAKQAGMAPANPETQSRLQGLQMWIGFFWQQLSMAFTPFSLIGYFASILFILRCPLPQRTWIYCLHFAFVLAAFLQPALDAAKIDLAGWWLQMPYHTYTNLIYALLSGLGTGLLIAFLARRRTVYFFLAPLLLVLPVYTFVGSEPASSQRDRWFGWMFGYDMLKDLPKGSIFFGGTDPGRFVPTYMILGESGQSPDNKRDPDFDRRDLYIITQNALGEEFYMNYIRDHYGEGRPQPKNAFERWLGREGAYPEKPLVLPTPDQVKEIFAKAVNPSEDSEFKAETDPNMIVFASVLRWLWEHNKEDHAMFIEESFPIRWTYDYALPHGLVYQLMKDKVPEIPKEVVEEDFRFWAAYKSRLLGDPNYGKDFDAQRSFSKLRSSIANIYHHRKMEAEAERAYLEALELWPANPEVLFALSRMSWDRGNFDKPLKLLENAYALDPHSTAIIQLAVMSEQRKASNDEIKSLKAKLEAKPDDEDAFIQLVGIFASWGETNKSVDFIEQGLQTFSNRPPVLKTLASFAEGAGMKTTFGRAASLLAAAEPENPMSHYILARALMANGDTNASFAAAEKSIQLGGRNVRELFGADGAFTNAVTNEPFKSLVNPPIPVPQGVKPPTE